MSQEAGNATLQVVHLSFSEFGAAASLCRKEVDLKKELTKITDLIRFTAVTTYLSGMLSQNQSIEFLNICKGICSNFLELVGTKQTGRKMQEVFSK